MRFHQILYFYLIILLFSPWVMSDSFVTRYTMAHQAPLSMGFSRQEYWSGLSFPSPGDLPDPEIETGSPALQAEYFFFFFAGRFFMAVALCKPQLTLIIVKNSMSLVET